MGVYEPDPGTQPMDTTLTQSQQEMRDLIHISKFRPGTPHFWGALALTGLGLGAYRATAPARVVLSWVRHPVMNYLSTYGRSTPIRYGAYFYLQASKAYRYSNYIAFAYSPFATYHYLKAGENEKAMIQWFGPPGSVYIYEKYFEKESKDKGRGPQARKRLREDTRTRVRLGACVHCHAPPVTVTGNGSVCWFL